MKVCPFCSAMIENKAKKCSSCWESIYQWMKIAACPYCDLTITFKAKKCGHCWKNIPRDENGKIKYDENKIKRQERKDKINNFLDKYFWVWFFVALLIFWIIIWFLVPKGYSSWVFVVIMILFFLALFYDSILNKEFFNDFFIKIFWLIVASGLCYLLLIWSSYIFALWLYKIWWMGPMTYAHLICDKFVGAVKECTIKWNVSYETWEKIYHLPWCVNYSETVIDKEYWESYFPNEKVAEKAWFRKCNDEHVVSDYDYDDYSPDYSDFYDDYMPRWR